MTDKQIHTPIPWIANGSVVRDATQTVFIAQRWTDRFIDEEYTDEVKITLYANARLIAAAPDLLEALEAIGTLPNGWCCCPFVRREDRQHVGECTKAREALAKAKAEVR